MSHTNAGSMKTDVGDLRRMAEAFANLGARLSDRRFRSFRGHHIGGPRAAAR